MERSGSYRPSPGGWTAHASTRGERRTAGNGLFRPEDNLESPWAHRALSAFYVALHFGEVPAMDRGDLEAGDLADLDHEGQLRASDDLPPMNTFLNRLLALRIADQNALFSAFDSILGGSGILERQPRPAGIVAAWKISSPTT